MQQRPNPRDQYLVRTKRTQPALPGATLPTAPVAAQPASTELYEPKSPPKKRPKNAGRRALLQLSFTGICLELLFLALYPLLAGATPQNDAAKQAWLGLFPWILQLSWTTGIPFIAQWLARISWLDPANTNSGGNINLLFLLLALAFGLTLVAGGIGRHVVQERLSRIDIRRLFSTILLFSVLFALTYLFASPVMAQDMFLYGLYGRLVTIYHVNPYTATLAAFPHDLLHQAVAKSPSEATLPGPVWIDLCLPVVLLAGESIANILLGFHIIGLLAHLANTVLLWFILAKLKPQTRVAATLLYAWNPLVLLLSICGMHLDVVLVLFLLLAILFFQRKSPIPGWVLVLLAVLINALCLLLLPLFFRLLSKEVRASQVRTGRHVLWWLAAVAISSIVILLAYAPYWQGWGLTGILTNVREAFFQDKAINSLDAALVNLPIKLPPALNWLIEPHHWTIFAAITVGCILLLGMWLADNVELVVLFSSWVMLALLVLLPVYWPWYTILPLVLALCSSGRRTILLALLLALGALVSFYFWLWQAVWASQALATLGLPSLLWGWILFFATTWEMTHKANEELMVQQGRRGRGLSWPSRPSLPSWPSRSSWPGRRR